jgi:hypothetical protein
MQIKIWNPYSLLKFLKSSSFNLLWGLSKLYIVCNKTNLCGRCGTYAQWPMTCWVTLCRVLCWKHRKFSIRHPSVSMLCFYRDMIVFLYSRTCQRMLHSEIYTSLVVLSSFTWNVRIQMTAVNVVACSEIILATRHKYGNLCNVSNCDIRSLDVTFNKYNVACIPLTVVCLHVILFNWLYPSSVVFDKIMPDYPSLRWAVPRACSGVRGHLCVVTMVTGVRWWRWSAWRSWSRRTCATPSTESRWQTGTSSNSNE